MCGLVGLVAGRCGRANQRHAGPLERGAVVAGDLAGRLAGTWQEAGLPTPWPFARAPGWAPWIVYLGSLALGIREVSSRPCLGLHLRECPRQWRAGEGEHGTP